jgi:lysophospholipase L1-like esterase
MPETTALALPVDVVHPADLRAGEASVSPFEPEYGYHLLAEGDSWFTLGAVPSSNLLYELRLAKWSQVFNLAYPGDTIKNIGNLAGNRDFRKFVVNQRFNYPWDALLLSGGGNDIIDAAPKLIRRRAVGPATEPASWIDSTALGELLKSIQQGIGQLHAMWNASSSKSAGRPIVLHTYDYATPRNAPARFLGTISVLGPWLYPAFQGTATSIMLQQRIANLLIDRLADALLVLDGACGGPEALANVHVVDTRNTLVMANPVDVGRSNDWLNEIHPTLEGYRKIAARLSATLNALLL